MRLLEDYNLISLITDNMDETRGKKLEEMLFMYQQMAMKSLAGPAGAWRPNSKHKFPLNGILLGIKKKL